MIQKRKISLFTLTALVLSLPLTSAYSIRPSLPRDASLPARELQQLRDQFDSQERAFEIESLS